ncbi:MAG: DUF6249 domain-containing protein [Acidobacteriota bacterium]
MQNNDAVAFVLFLSIMAIITIVLILVRYAHRRLHHREILKAIEHGQPVPMPVKTPRRHSYVDDLRTGVLLTSLSIGLALFFVMVGGDEAVGVAAVPLFIGIGFMVNAYLSKRLGNENGGAKSAVSATPVASELRAEGHPDDSSLP